MTSAENPLPKLRGSFDPTANGNGEMEARRELIRRQLTEILASSAFRNSKRYSTLLKYLVERTLEGQAKELKERNIGVDVFERPADYDTTTDHVVRSAGGEIRKRLAQYYLDHGHETDIRIDLYAGSYVPQFRLCTAEPQDTNIAVTPAVVNPETKSAWPAGRSLGRLPVLLAVFSAGAALALATALLFTHRPPTALDRFWAPVTSRPVPVLLCIGSYICARPDGPQVAGISLPTASPAGILTEPGTAKLPVGAEDAIALARIAGTLQAVGKDFRVLAEPDTTFDDLRQGPAVLIGAINNSWVLRLTGALRYRFEDATASAEPYIRDSQSPTQGPWHAIRSTESGQCTRDYAIVARCWNPETSQMVVVAAGAHPWGTRAAGEFLTNPAYLKDLDARAQKSGGRKNLQVVLSTDIVKGVTGPPNIVAAYFW
jgi:hypothetical protein